MLIKRKLIPFILCVIMLIPLIGCSEAQQTVAESASLPDISQYSKPKFDTEPPVSESSSQEVTEPETESSTVTESSWSEIQEEETSLPQDIDKFISNDYVREEHYYLYTITESDWGTAPGYSRLEPRINGIFLDDDLNYKKPRTVYLSDSLITSYQWTNGYVLVFAEGDSIRQINLSGDIKTIYTSPDGNPIWSFYILMDYIYVVEGNYLYVVNYNTMDRRCISWVGDVTAIQPSIDSTRIIYIKRNYYNGDYMFQTAHFPYLSESGEQIDGKYSGLRDTDFDSEYFAVDISNGSLYEISSWTFYME